MRQKAFFAFLFILIATCVIHVACKTPPPPPEEVVVILPRAPQFDLQDIRVKEINSTMVELYIFVKLVNPNAYELPRPRLTFDYRVYETSIVRDRLRHGERPLPPSSTVPIEFGIVIKYADLYKAIPELIRFREADSVLKLTCDMGIPIQNDEPTKLNVPYTLPIHW